MSTYETSFSAPQQASAGRGQIGVVIETTYQDILPRPHIGQSGLTCVNLDSFWSGTFGAWLKPLELGAGSRESKAVEHLGWLA